MRALGTDGVPDRSDLQSIAWSAWERFRASRHPFLRIFLKAEAFLLAALIPLLVLAQGPPVESLGIFDYLATWTIIWMAVVAMATVLVVTALYLNRGVRAAFGYLRDWTPDGSMGDVATDVVPSWN